MSINVLMWISYFTLFLLSTVVIKLFCGYAKLKGLVDVPNARSSHEIITPRGAGVVFASLWCLFLYWIVREENFSLFFAEAFLPGALLITVMGYLDDYKQLSAWFRLIVQIAAAVLFIYVLGRFSGFHVTNELWTLGALGLPVAVFAIVWSINLFNFMDGLDGLAGVEGIFLFGVGGFFFFLTGHLHFAYLAWALVAVLLGFLVWNWPRASVFMGSAGSYFLGFMVMGFALVGEVFADLPVGFWLMIYSAFWFDTGITLARRILTGQKWYMAHRSHAFQRLHQAGWSVSKILWGMIGLNSFLTGMALWSYYERHKMTTAWCWILGVLTLIYFLIECLYPMRKCKADQLSLEFQVG